LENHPVNAVPPDKLPPPAMEMKGWTIDVQKLVVDVPPKIDVEDDATTPVVEKSPELYSTPLLPETLIHVVQRVGGGPGAGFPETAA
jgi:hypothetical protein